ncbi:hypothetical protein JCM18899A_52820 [Nocardioides sp. AN3]
MIPWCALIATLSLNYARHRRGKSTLCSVTRRHVPVQTPEGRAAVILAWSVLSGWLIPHLCSKRVHTP